MKKEFHKIFRQRKEISVRYDPKREAIWLYSNPSIRPCYSLALVKEVHELQLDIIDYYRRSNMKPKTPVKYFVVASQTPGVYNYGGDLNLFAELIAKKDYDSLYEYAKLCIDFVYLNRRNLNLPITTISLIEGTALGGGFEAALSCNVCIAEEQSQMGLPEIRFNLIPGMGAYSFLARSVGIRKAEEIISSGKIYDAATLHDMGVITTLAKKGEGKKDIDELMRKNSRQFNGMQAIYAARQRYSPIDYGELIDITKIWADTALKLSKKDMKLMLKLVEAQNLKNIDKTHKVRTRQDRRFDEEDVSFPFTDSHGDIVLCDRRKGVDKRDGSQGDLQDDTQ
ncbi:MAG: crotonase/enoyl-CoA hydratase family protein [Campylobacterota bacterium]|nr:crotonase/enoyl-CoA hydratase family protein [Campylobacterota bacterium]